MKHITVNARELILKTQLAILQNNNIKKSIYIYIYDDDTLFSNT